jgi:hypothetical protein
LQLAWALGLPPRRSARLQAMEASTSQDPTSPASTIPPTSPVRAASPPVYVGDIPIITFEDSLQDDIGEHNEDYFDSQEFLEGRE